MRKNADGHHVRDGASSSMALDELLRQAMPPVCDDAGQPRDLWPAMARRLEQSVTSERQQFRVTVSWYDWALGAAVLVLAVVSPVSIPVLLYYL